jgi:hypothetical protein
MKECKSMSTLLNQKEKFCKEDQPKKIKGVYRSLIGCLMYLTATRPDNMHHVSLLSRFMHCANEVHCNKIYIYIVKYIKGALDHGIQFTRIQNLELQSYANSYWAGCFDDTKSTLG